MCLRGHHGRVEKREGRKTSRRTPSQKTGFGPPSSGVIALFFPVQKSTTEQTRGYSGGVQKFSGGCFLWNVFLPPYVFVPEILQSGFFFGGEFLILAQRILGELPANFSATFYGNIFPRFFRPCFFRDSGPPSKNSRPKFTQNSRQSSPSSLSQTQFFFRGDFLLTGEINTFCSPPYLRRP